MTSAPGVPARGLYGSLGRALGWFPSSVSRLRRHPPPEQLSAVLLTAVAIGIALGGTLASRNWFPPSLLSLVVLFGGLLMSRRGFLRVALVVAASLGYYLYDLGLDQPR